MKNPIFKILAVVVACIFTFTTISWAGPHRVYTLKIPAKYGQVKERYQGSSDAVVVHIQDAHTSFDAQKNLCNIIEYLVNEQDVSVVAAEGAEGNANLNKLRRIPRLENKRTVAESFMRDGRLKGTEVANVMSPRYFDIFGAEDMDLYDINAEAFVNTLSKREEILDEIEAVENILNDLKAPVYSEETATFDTAIAEYRSGILNFFEYCGKLLTYAGKTGIDISHYVNFTMLLEAKSWEDQIDFDKVDAERRDVINQLTVELSQGTDSLTQKKRDILERQLSHFEQSTQKKSAEHTEFYTLLKNLATEYNIDYESAQNFYNFATYITIFSRLDKSGLLLECKELERDIENRLAVNASEKELIYLSRHIRLLKDIVELKVLPEDVTYYRNNKEKFSAAVFENYINAKAPHRSVDGRIALLDEILPSVDDFYRFAEERSNVITAHCLAELERRGVSILPLIAGGYHTDGITKALKAKGMSYIVVTPQLGEALEDVPYVERMLNVKTPFELMIQAAYNTIVHRFVAAVRQGEIPGIPRLPAGLTYEDIISVEFLEDMQKGLIARLIFQGEQEALATNLPADLVTAIRAYMADLGIERFTVEYFDATPSTLKQTFANIAYVEKTQLVSKETQQKLPPLYTIFFIDGRQPMRPTQAVIDTLEEEISAGVITPEPTFNLAGAEATVLGAALRSWAAQESPDVLEEVRRLTPPERPQIAPSIDTIAGRIAREELPQVPLPPQITPADATTINVEIEPDQPIIARVTLQDRTVEPVTKPTIDRPVTYTPEVIAQLIAVAARTEARVPIVQGLINVIPELPDRITLSNIVGAEIRGIVPQGFDIAFILEVPEGVTVTEPGIPTAPGTIERPVTVTQEELGGLVARAVTRLLEAEPSSPLWSLVPEITETALTDSVPELPSGIYLNDIIDAQIQRISPESYDLRFIFEVPERVRVSELPIQQVPITPEAIAALIVSAIGRGDIPSVSLPPGFTVEDITATILPIRPEAKVIEAQVTHTDETVLLAEVALTPQNVAALIMSAARADVVPSIPGLPVGIELTDIVDVINIVLEEGVVTAEVTLDVAPELQVMQAVTLAPEVIGRMIVDSRSPEALPVTDITIANIEEVTIIKSDAAGIEVNVTYLDETGRQAFEQKVTLTPADVATLLVNVGVASADVLPTVPGLPAGITLADIQAAEILTIAPESVETWITFRVPEGVIVAEPIIGRLTYEDATGVVVSEPVIARPTYETPAGVTVTRPTTTVDIPITPGTPLADQILNYILTIPTLPGVILAPGVTEITPTDIAGITTVFYDVTPSTPVLQKLSGAVAISQTELRDAEGALLATLYMAFFPQAEGTAVRVIKTDIIETIQAEIDRGVLQPSPDTIGQADSYVAEAEDKMREPISPTRLLEVLSGKFERRGGQAIMLKGDIVMSPDAVAAYQRIAADFDEAALDLGALADEISELPENERADVLKTAVDTRINEITTTRPDVDVSMFRRISDWLAVDAPKMPTTIESARRDVVLEFFSSIKDTIVSNQQAYRLLPLEATQALYQVPPVRDMEGGQQEVQYTFSYPNEQTQTVYSDTRIINVLELAIRSIDERTGERGVDTTRALAALTELVTHESTHLTKPLDRDVEGVITTDVRRHEQEVQAEAPVTAESRALFGVVTELFDVDTGQVNYDLLPAISIVVEELTDVTSLPYIEARAIVEPGIAGVVEVAARTHSALLVHVENMVSLITPDGFVAENYLLDRLGAFLQGYPALGPIFLVSDTDLTENQKENIERAIYDRLKIGVAVINTGEQDNTIRTHVPAHKIIVVGKEDFVNQTLSLSAVGNRGVGTITDMFIDQEQILDEKKQPKQYPIGFAAALALPLTTRIPLDPEKGIVELPKTIGLLQLIDGTKVYNINLPENFQGLSDTAMQQALRAVLASMSERINQAKIAEKTILPSA